MTEDNYEKALKIIELGKGYDEDYLKQFSGDKYYELMDMPTVINMVKYECLPEETYVEVDDEDEPYGSISDVFADVGDILDYKTWDEMDEDELEMWCEIVSSISEYKV